ncbi:MAG TPA: endolytic transglycosylase MltG [Solirubrobacteraceae bacterium]|nr:endolytic transglycosylase MltG [Solirubrobacteraceae bacterium]
MAPSGAGLAGHALPEQLPVEPHADEDRALPDAALHFDASAEQASSDQPLPEELPPPDGPPPPDESPLPAALPTDVPHDPHATQAFDVLAEPLLSEAHGYEEGAHLYEEDDETGEEPEALTPLPPPGGESRRTVRIGADRVASYAPADAGEPPRGRGRGRARAAAAAAAGRRGVAAGGRKRVTRARVAALVALALAAAVVWFLISLFQPFSGGQGSGRAIVVIPKGSSSSKIGSILAHDGVVSSGFFFNLRATLDGKRGSLHSGRFELKHGMSYSAAIDALSKPPPKAIVVKLVIPEGYTRRQIAQLVHEDALSGDYLTASKRSAALNPRDYGAPTHTPDLEGFLFPATYELTAGAPVKRLVDEQLAAFEEHLTSADKRRARELHVTPYQLLTVASMIEREAQTAGDRPKIAAVIYNRLREGIPLGIDATIYYAVEEQKGIATYTGELTDSQLKIDSPYNTRTHKGLPPTPISNPGVASIEAAAHPAHVPYLYYVAGADGCGEQVFSRTSAEFEKNVAAYDAAVKKNGGHPPACKKK